TLNRGGQEPVGFKVYPEKTNCDTVHGELDHGAKMAILDARAPPDYTSEHIAGAVSVPFYDPAPFVPKLPKDTWLVCYGSCPIAPRSNFPAAGSTSPSRRSKAGHTAPKAAASFRSTSAASTKATSAMTTKKRSTCATPKVARR